MLTGLIFHSADAVLILPLSPDHNQCQVKPRKHKAAMFRHGSSTQPDVIEIDFRISTG